MPPAVRKQIDAATMLYMERMSKYMRGTDAQEKRKVRLGAVYQSQVRR